MSVAPPPQLRPAGGSTVPLSSSSIHSSQPAISLSRSACPSSSSSSSFSSLLASRPLIISIAPPDAETVSLSTSPSSSSPPPRSFTCLVSCLNERAPLSPHRNCLVLFTHPAFLRCLFITQLLLHTAYLVASLVLLARPQLVTDLLQSEAAPGFARWVLQYVVPVFLVVRCMVAVPLTVRRLWLMKRWRPTMSESLLTAILLVVTSVVGGMGMAAVVQLPAFTAASCVLLWALVGSLLPLAGSQLAGYVLLLLFFPLREVTLSLPMVPLAADRYDWSIDGSSPPRRPAGLTQQQLDALPISVYAGQRSDECCAVCMDDVEVGQSQRVLPQCGHAFHAACIDQWLLKKPVCPLCVRTVRVWKGGSSTPSQWMVEMVEQGRSESSVA